MGNLSHGWKQILNLKTIKMRIIKSISLLFLLVGSISVNAQNDKDQQIINDAEKIKQKMLGMDPGLQNFFDSSSGYAIFPNVGEGSFIVGGASGNGVVYEDDSAIGMADLKKLDIGLQAGGQKVAEVIFFESEEALAKFKDDQFTFSAEAAAVILEEGVSKNANYSDEVLVFAMPKAGAMVDLSVGGQQFRFVPFQDEIK
jgi:lipid-binding SYLF domain-containing protein